MNFDKILDKVFKISTVIFAGFFATITGVKYLKQINYWDSSEQSKGPESPKGPINPNGPDKGEPKGPESPKGPINPNGPDKDPKLPIK